MRVFLPYTAIGSAVWNAIFVGAGYQLGTHWQQVEKYSRPLNTLVILLIAALLIFWVATRVVLATPISGGPRRNTRAPAKHDSDC